MYTLSMSSFFEKPWKSPIPTQKKTRTFSLFVYTLAISLRSSLTNRFLLTYCSSFLAFVSVDFSSVIAVSGLCKLCSSLQATFACLRISLISHRSHHNHFNFHKQVIKILFISATFCSLHISYTVKVQHVLAWFPEW